MSIISIVGTFFLDLNMIRFFKIPTAITIWFPKYVWQLPNATKKIYLTFDDGPIPEVTERVLDILKQEKINATFFCIGDNIKKHPAIYQRFLNEGHQTGNHTFNHLNGWKTNTKNYIENFKLCETEIKKYEVPESKNTKIRKSNTQIPTSSPLLFRPPHGKIKPKQAKEIQKLGYKIIMWSVLSYDFDANLHSEKCLSETIKNTSNGSIIVFHDSIKANDNLKFVLPKVIRELKNKGFRFEKLF